MKGIILAGGLGLRLSPLTQNENKHYLPVYNMRMIEYPLMTLKASGIKDILVVCGGNSSGKFIEYMGSGKGYGCNLYYTYQDGNGGVADALLSAEKFMQPNESCSVILGDNYFEKRTLTTPQPDRHGQAIYGARVFLKKTETPWHFGVAEVTGDRITSIEEKPSEPKSDLAILGLYQFDSTVWDKIRRCEVSLRGELEITDVLKMYMAEGNLEYQMYDGYWSDMGTVESWMEVSQRIASQCTL